jgi:hypothetical protein
MPGSTRHPSMRRLGLSFVMALLTVHARAATIPDDEAAFNDWAKHKQLDIGGLERYLTDSQVRGIVPTRHLLRTATDWRKCGGPQFEVPPPAQWPDIKQVLRLVEELKKRKIVEEFEAVSNYRNPILNRCAGGAPKSSHTKSFALDILPINGKVDERGLCEFWRVNGKTWDMGLSKYPSGRIHIDVSGYRTWGATHGRESAFCVRGK